MAKKTVSMMSIKKSLAILIIFLGISHALAQQAVVDEALNESVQMIPKKGLFTVALETTLYKPPGDGPFPVVVVNHGKSPGNPRFQSRYRPASAARYFLQRGYAVVVPMRQGFSKSEGSYMGAGCNVESNGELQATDVKAVLDYVVAQPWADKDHVLVIGQSHGGWTTLAFGALNYPGVKALVNFAGGLRQDDCVGWEGALAVGARDYAKNTHVPSLWFYGDNDSFFRTSTYQAMFDGYVASGGQARLVAFGKFGTESHKMFGSKAGERIWQPEVTAFLETVGMPSSPLERYANYAAQARTEVPPRTDFAEFADETKIPFVKDSGRIAYKNYLTKSFPRAFAISPTGAWGWAEEGDDPLKRALDSCNKNKPGTCMLYSVDDFIVWTGESPSQ